MKDPSERPIPTMFADDEDICKHKRLYWECNECEEDFELDHLINIRKEEDDNTKAK